MLLAIDPGLSKMGWALFDGETLVRAGLTRRKSTDPQRGPGAWERIVSRTIEDVDGRLVTKVISEVMQVDVRTSNKVKDLLEVQGVAALFLGWGHSQGIPTIGVTPRDWKGSVPKEITKSRIMNKLSADELSVIPPNATHDVFDAIGIGLYYHWRK